MLAKKQVKLRAKFVLPKQILLPPAAQNHQDFGPTAASPSILPVFSFTSSS
jgi:hypothetical protein